MYCDLDVAFRLTAETTNMAAVRFYSLEKRNRCTKISGSDGDEWLGCDTALHCVFRFTRAQGRDSRIFGV